MFVYVEQPYELRDKVFVRGRLRAVTGRGFTFGVVMGLLHALVVGVGSGIYTCGAEVGSEIP